MASASARAGKTGFTSYRNLESLLNASPATIRRDLIRLEEAGHIARVHGGAKLADDAQVEKYPGFHLTGTPFSVAITQKRRLIGRAEEVILLADSPKFHSSSGTIVCGLQDVDVLITDSGIAPEMAKVVEAAGIRLIVVEPAMA